MPRRRTGVPFRALFGFVILAVGALIALQMGTVGLETAGTDNTTTTNESLVVTYSNDVHVSASTSRYTQSYADTEAVYNSTGDQLVEGTDYDWNTTDGGVTFYNTANTTDGNIANITYEYSRNVESIRQSEGGVRATIEALGGPLVLAPAVTFLGLLLIGFVYWLTSAMGMRGSRGGR